MLDCDTAVGLKFIEHQYNTQAVLESLGYIVINTPTKDHNSDVIICREDNGIKYVYGLAEIKSRRFAGSKPLTVEYIRDKGGYLITYSKIKIGSDLAYQIGVPYFLIVNLIEQGKLLIWKITNSQGIFEFEFETKKTVTKETCNGGRIERVNAYLPIEKAKVIDSRIYKR